MSAATHRANRPRESMRRPTWCYLWAAPNSLAGLLLAAIACSAGASARQVDGTLEVAGGRLARHIARPRRPFGFSAITFGHVILGLDHALLARVRAHEHVHVRQYERWGPLFIPLYLASSLLEALRGRDPYHANHFERQARRADAA